MSGPVEHLHDADDDTDDATDDATERTVVDEIPWRRLDARMLAVDPARQLVRFLPIAVIVLVSGGGSGLDGRFYGVLGAAVLVVLYGVGRWFTTRYRVTEERVELRGGLVFRSDRSVPRDRVRSVDVTAGPLHRIFGLSVLTVGTGEQTGATESNKLALDAVAAAEAERLRPLLLDRTGSTPVHGTPDATATGPTAAIEPSRDGEQLAVLNWSWLRYAPLTASSLAAMGGVAGAGFQLADQAGFDPTDIGQVAAVEDQLTAAPLWAAITVSAVVLLMIAVVGALLLFVEGWWRYRLTREVGETLRVRRGLLTARSVSLEQRRLRGIELTEPLLLRLGRGARLSAVATGLGSTETSGSRSALLPPAPRAIAGQVGATVLREQRPPTDVELRRHPPAALRRRIVRALPLPVIATVVLLLTPAPHWTLLAPALVLVLGLAIAVDGYRNLGHALTDDYLVIRSGSILRRTVALQRVGTVGWTLRQSPLQRRAGLATLTAATAAGSGAYHVEDLAFADGVALAQRLVPIHRT